MTQYPSSHIDAEDAALTMLDRTTNFQFAGDVWKAKHILPVAKPPPPPLPMATAIPTPHGHAPAPAAVYGYTS